MVSIGRVWDGTTQVLGGRGGTLAGIAALAIFLPTVVNRGYIAFVPQTTGAKALEALIAIVVLVVTIWGQLAIVALSSDPATTRADATALATRRLPVQIGILLLIGIVGILSIVPAIVALGSAMTPAALIAMQHGVMPTVAPGGALFALLYLIVWSIALLVVSARLVGLHAVIVNERLGVGAIARAFRLTHGLTWKLIGVLILYAIVLIVAMGAAQAVVGIVFRLILGANGIAVAGFLGAVAAAVVTTALSVVAGVFGAQLYVATRDASPIA